MALMRPLLVPAFAALVLAAAPQTSLAVSGPICSGGKTEIVPPQQGKVFNVTPATAEEVKKYLRQFSCSNACYDIRVTFQVNGLRMFAAVVATNRCVLSVSNPTGLDPALANPKRGCASGEARPRATVITPTGKQLGPKDRCDGKLDAGLDAMVDNFIATGGTGTNPDDLFKDVEGVPQVTSSITGGANAALSAALQDKLGIQKDKADEIVAANPNKAFAMLTAYANGKADALETLLKNEGLELTDDVRTKSERLTEPEKERELNGVREMQESFREQSTFAPSATPSPGRKPSSAENRDVLLRVRQALSDSGVDPNCLTARGHECQAPAIRTAIDASLKALEERGLRHAALDAYAVLAIMRREQSFLGNANTSSTGCGGIMQLCGGTIDTVFQRGLTQFAKTDQLANIVAGTMILNDKFFSWVPQDNPTVKDLVNGFQAYNGINCSGCGGDTNFGARAYNDALAMRNAVFAGGGDVHTVAQALIGLDGSRSRTLADRLSFASALLAQPIGTTAASAGLFPIGSVAGNIPFAGANSLERGALPNAQVSPFSMFGSLFSKLGGGSGSSGGGSSGGGSSSGGYTSAPAAQSVSAQQVPVSTVISQPQGSLAIPPQVQPVASLLAQKKEVARGETIVISWSSVGMRVGEPCRLTQKAGTETALIASANEGSKRISTETAQSGSDWEFTLQCTAISGTTITQAASVRIQ